MTYDANSTTAEWYERLLRERAVRQAARRVLERSARTAALRILRRTDRLSDQGGDR